MRSGRRHSRYRRAPRDLPWRGYPVRLRVWARRFFCDAPARPRKVFAEPFPGLVGRYARRTAAATRLLLGIAQRAGGEAGARLAREAGLPTSPDTLLRLLRASAPAAAEEAPAVLGVDDFAWRRGATYGLLLVDLATRRPVDVLPDAEAGALAAWLRAHPGARVVARDRGHQVVEGVTRGAPAAAPVADRFHLVRNVREALDALQQQRRRAGSPAFRDPAASHLVASPAAPLPRPPPPPEPDSPPAAPRRSYRVGPEQWARARARRAAGAPIRAIGRELGVAHRTVRRLPERPDAPVQEYERPRPIPRAVVSFFPYLRRRRAEGCTNGRQLTRELEALGYAGSGSSVPAAVHRPLGQRLLPPRPARRRDRAGRPLVRPVPPELRRRRPSSSGRYHSHLKQRLYPMRGLKQGTSADVVARGHALIRNLRQGSSKLTAAVPLYLRLSSAWRQPARAI